MRDKEKGDRKKERERLRRESENEKANERFVLGERNVRTKLSSSRLKI